ncbi:MAG: D-tyrosyl-tRNA(Tyr) deacylase [Bacteroidetes bacterium]|nr:D-tyrosyl-tRNA(Tyr) deacylase [Bacteroidota bacterium]
MRAVVQRVSRASVTVNDQVVGSIGRGMMVLLGILDSDTEADADWMASKLISMRVFPDDHDKMNRSVLDCGGEVLIVSQFTLYGDTRKGNRPSFIRSAGPAIARPLVDRVIQRCEELTGKPVATGIFGAMMQVELINDGPVTLIIDSKEV